MRGASTKSRELAVERGLRFIYTAACDSKSFDSHDFEYLSCFSHIALTSSDPNLRRMAREMGRERARRWRKDHPALPSLAEVKTVAEFIDANVAADRLGVRDGNLIAQIRRRAARFDAYQTLGFDPSLEAPPPDVPKRCRCGVKSRPGRKTCQQCRRRLKIQNRYETWMQALYRGYRTSRSGVALGTRYEDAIRWLPEMHPYPSAEGDEHDFYWCAYAVTHVVYTLNDYGFYKLAPRWLPREFQFLRENVEHAISMDDPDMVGEFLETLKTFGLADNHRLIRKATDYLLSTQNQDGSWGDPEEKYACDRYHPTWTAVDGLRDHAWRGERISFPRMKTLLEKWARKK